MADYNADEPVFQGAWENVREAHFHDMDMAAKRRQAADDHTDEMYVNACADRDKYRDMSDRANARVSKAEIQLKIQADIIDDLTNRVRVVESQLKTQRDNARLERDELEAQRNKLQDDLPMTTQRLITRNADALLEETKRQFKRVIQERDAVRSEFDASQKSFGRLSDELDLVTAERDDWRQHALELAKELRTKRHPGADV